MTNILHITASISGADSISRQLSTRLVEGLVARDGGEVTDRDLSANELPYVSAERFAANGTPIDARTAEQTQLAAIADALIAELQTADTIVIGTPIYNFGVPASLKAWADLVARAGTTFQYTANGPEGLLKGKKAYVTVASGGTTVDSPIDFMTPWLKQFLAFLGVTDVTVIAADARMSQGGAEKVEAAKARIDEIIA